MTCDVSFISLAKALPPALSCAAPGWRALVLVKPQFEAGRADVGKGGVVRDPEVHRRVLEEISAHAPEWGARVLGTIDSGLPGPKGNREFFLYLVAADSATYAVDNPCGVASPLLLLSLWHIPLIGSVSGVSWLFALWGVTLALVLLRAFGAWKGVEPPPRRRRYRTPRAWSTGA